MDYAIRHLYDDTLPDINLGLRPEHFIDMYMRIKRYRECIMHSYEEPSSRRYLVQCEEDGLDYFINYCGAIDLSGFRESISRY